MEETLFLENDETFSLKSQVLEQEYSGRGLQLNPEKILLSVESGEPEILIRLLEKGPEMKITDEKQRTYPARVDWVSDYPQVDAPNEVLCCLRLYSDDLFNEYAFRYRQKGQLESSEVAGFRRSRVLNQQKKPGVVKKLVYSLFTLGGTIPDIIRKVKKGI